MQDPIQELLAHWADQGVRPAPPEPDAVTALEALSGSRLPADFKRYLEATDGVDNGVDQYHFWPSREIVRANTEPAVSDRIDPHLYIFADYLQVCWWYCVRLQEGARNGEIAFLDNDYYRPICGSFAEFIRLYMADDTRLQIQPGDPKFV
jgi:hypothetical protein